jgi:hypothetical protein
MFASEHGVPRTTLQYWLARKNTIDASDVPVSFFESPEAGVSTFFLLRRSLNGRRCVNRSFFLLTLPPVGFRKKRAASLRRLAQSFASQRKNVETPD